MQKLVYNPFEQKELVKPVYNAIRNDSINVIYTSDEKENVEILKKLAKVVTKV